MATLTDVGVESSDSQSLSQNGKNKLQSQPSSQSRHHRDEDEDEDESKSEWESDSESEFNIRTKFMNDPREQAAVKKLNRAALATPAKRRAKGKEAESKRLKKKQERAVEAEASEKNLIDSKKLLFQRFWSEEDEVVILKGMIDYEAKNKSNPVADWNAFHNFIKNDLHVVVTKSQLKDKIRRLKKKYLNKKKREKEDRKCYKLSKKVWKKEYEGLKNVSKELDNNTKENVNDDILQEKLLEVKTERKKLKVEEMKLRLKTLDLIRAQSKFILDLLKLMSDD